ncbi:MAG TPA: hypothetical protein VE860_18930 [Chthoniobacterales bacterium]|nr:hypothetical protein [Chthoniobacterales bacterium]
MKKRWMSRCLDEAAFLAIVLALAFGQSQLGANPKRASLSEGPAPLVIQVEKGLNPSGARDD